MMPARLIAYLAADPRLTARERIVFSTVGSTNAVGRAVATHYLNELSASSKCVIVAQRQTAGRGRLGRIWNSPAGGVYASYVWRCRGVEELRILPLRVAVALRAALGRWTGRPCRLKWPNDLVVEDRKIGGLLIETVSKQEAVVAVIGFGVNYDRVPVESGPTAVGLTELAAVLPPLQDVVVDLLVAVEQALESPRSAVEVVAEYARWSAHRVGDSIRCRTPRGLYEGEFLGFDPTGLLRLGTAAGEQVVSSGDILEPRMSR